MPSTETFWKRIGLHDWFLKKTPSSESLLPSPLTADEIYKYIIEEFRRSVDELSFADRVVFYHEFIICFNAEDYQEFMNNKKGIFGLIIQETIKEFYAILRNFKEQGKIVEPSGNKWVFRFVSHPDYPRGDKSFIGKLLPENVIEKNDNLRITYIPRQTGMAETTDINNEILKDFTFYSDGYYEIPYREDLVADQNQKPAVKSVRQLGRLEAIIPEKEYAGKKIEFIINEDDIIVSGSEDERKDTHIFKIPSDWVNVPHLRIKFNKADGKFYVASFGEKTILNEMDLPSTDINEPSWTMLPVNSKLVLNGIVGLNLYK